MQSHYLGRGLRISIYSFFLLIIITVKVVHFGIAVEVVGKWPIEFIVRHFHDAFTSDLAINIFASTV